MSVSKNIQNLNNPEHLLYSIKAKRKDGGKTIVFKWNKITLSKWMLSELWEMSKHDLDLDQDEWEIYIEGEKPGMLETYDTNPEKLGEYKSTTGT